MLKSILHAYVLWMMVLGAISRCFCTLTSRWIGKWKAPIRIPYRGFSFL